MSFALPSNMPSLNLAVPAEHQRSGNIELNESLLSHWINRLPDNDPIEFYQRYLDALDLFNHNQVPPGQRLKLLDIYRGPVNEYLFNLSSKQLDALPSSTRLRVIHDSMEVLNHLAIGYKIIIMDAGKVNEDLSNSAVGQMAVYRSIEQLSLLALNAYKFYRTLPQNLFRELHQIYLLSVQAELAEKIPFINKQLKADYTFKQRYIQFLLTSICDPYSLQFGEILQTYKLMIQLTQTAKLTHYQEGEQVKAGHFYINSLADHSPVPAALPKSANYGRLPTQILDTKSILIKVNELFEKAEKAGPSHPAFSSIRLLKKVTPFLNTSYERKQPRLPVDGEAETYICIGLEAIHQALTQKQSLSIENHPWLASKWEVLNKNDYGYLVQKRKVAGAHDLGINDFVGIFDQDKETGKITAKLASVRWVRTDDFEQSKMGLKFIEGEATPIHFVTEGAQHSQAAFLMPEIGVKQEATLIVAAGIFKAGTILHIKMRQKILNFSVIMHELIESNDSFEQFTFRHHNS